MFLSSGGVWNVPVNRSAKIIFSPKVRLRFEINGNVIFHNKILILPIVWLSVIKVLSARNPFFWSRVARWFVFKPKIPIWVNYFMATLSFNWPFGIFHGNLLYFSRFGKL
jgi:hypothetical protein